MAYNREAFINAIEEYVGYALLEYYKAKLAARTGQRRRAASRIARIRDLLERGEALDLNGNRAFNRGVIPELSPIVPAPALDPAADTRKPSFSGRQSTLSRATRVGAEETALSGMGYFWSFGSRVWAWRLRNRLHGQLGCR